MLSLSIVAGLVFLVLARAAGALEIFRIGGEDQPHPEQAEIHFHPLSWNDFEEKAGLDEQAFAQGVLRPLLLDPAENIARTSVERGGGVYIGGSVWESMIDGDPKTYSPFFPNLSYCSGMVEWRRITLDLGRSFHVNRVRLLTAERGHYPEEIDVLAHQVPLLKLLEAQSWGCGTPPSSAGKQVYRVAENVRDTIDVRFPPVSAWTAELLIYRSSPKDIKVGEVEVYGEGYIEQASYVSPFIDLGEPAIWGDLRWGGRKDPQAQVHIQSRAGKGLDPNIYWRFTGRGSETSRFDEEGRPLDATTYARLKGDAAAPITYDTENWGFWSPPYEFADNNSASVLSPGPNSVFQLRVDFLSTLSDGGEVEFIEFSATQPPLAEEVIGEIYPPEVPLGEIAQFTYVLRPTIRAQHSGFDQVEISTPFGLEGVDTVKVDGALVSYEVGQLDSTRFSIQLPHPLKAEDAGKLIEVVFRASVLRYGTTFDGWVRDTSRPLELAQRINPGDASSRIRSETLSVRTSFSDRLIADLRVEPRTFTPNRDGVNEGVNFSFDLLQLTGGTPLRLEVFDLSGRLVRVVYEGQQQSGRFRFSWDGRDENRELVSPGLYLYRIAVGAEKGQDQRAGTIAVVY